jgi:hypothetical protein
MLWSTEKSLDQYAARSHTDCAIPGHVCAEFVSEVDHKALSLFVRIELMRNLSFIVSSPFYNLRTDINIT